MAASRALAMVLAVAAGLAIAAAATGEAVSPWVVLPPLVAAVAVLGCAALAVDYFGLRRRADDWRGPVHPGAAAWARVRALEARFGQARAVGAVHAAATARSLLIALAELDVLERATDVVDFLAGDAVVRARPDPCADALRALALTRLGRAAEAERVDRRLSDAVSALPVVAWSRARIALGAGAPSRALAALDRARVAPATDVAHELAAVRARALTALGRGDDARRVLGELAGAAGRPWVERLATDDDAAVGMVARQALGLHAAYR